MLETAIEEAGVHPVVVSTEDAARGVAPLAHQRCLIVKVHGDYLDSRILNTPSELEAYGPNLTKLLDDVFDAFGLVVCGWSSDGDVALRGAIERTTSRRFSCYWAALGELRPHASKLLALRDGVEIPIQDADTFFEQLAERVEALQRARSPHPDSVAALVEMAKRFMSNPPNPIRLDDLVHDETEAARSRIEEAQREWLGKPNQEWPCKRDQLERLGSGVERVLAMLLQIAAWGPPPQEDLVSRAIARLFVTQEIGSRPVLDGLAAYPAILTLYGAGVVALARGRWELLRDLLYSCRVRTEGMQMELLGAVAWGKLRELIEDSNPEYPMRTAHSAHFFEVLRAPLRRFLPDHGAYEEAFDEFEYLVTMVVFDREWNGSTSSADPRFDPPAPLGRYFRSASRGRPSVVDRAKSDLEKLGRDWPPLRSGFFRGDAERARELQVLVDRLVARLAR